MTRLRPNQVQSAMVVALIAAITALRFVFDEPGPLYLFPVILAGLWFGRWPGLGVGVVCTALYGITSTLDGNSEAEPLAVALLVRLAIYGIAGWLVGSLSEARLRLAQELRGRDLELAELRTIQEALAPAEPPERPALELATCYLPAEHGVSGDFYVVAPGQDGATLIAVGDVAGRGLEAAKRAWYVRTLIASSADVTDDPGAVLERANRALIDESGFAAPFVTAACILFEPDGRIRWALAGHDVPIRLDEGSALQGAGETGLPLGVTARIGCETSTTRLAPGGGLLLFTDGLPEARRPRNGSATIELFGERRIKGLVSELTGSSTVDVVERVRTEVRGFSGGELADDLCLIALRLSEQPDTTDVC